MEEVKTNEQMAEESLDKKGFIAWVNENKVKLLAAGVSITALIAMIVGLKNKDAIINLWNSLKKQIEKGTLYSAKWFENSTLEELRTARRVVELDHRNPDLDMEYRGKCWDLLKVFDKYIGEKEWKGKEFGYPVHTDGGWHLLGDD